jgi:hypothetical protein
MSRPQIDEGEQGLGTPPYSLNLTELIEQQSSDPELQQLTARGDAGLKLCKIQVPGVQGAIWADATGRRKRSYIPGTMRRALFDSLHYNTHTQESMPPEDSSVRDTYGWQ